MKYFATAFITVETARKPSKWSDGTVILNSTMFISIEHTELLHIKMERLAIYSIYIVPREESIAASF